MEILHVEKTDHDNNKTVNTSMMVIIISLILLYSISTVSSIVLLGDKTLISGNLFQVKNVFFLMTNWKFILSMTFAIIARIAFTLFNSTILKVPHLANASTTLTTFMTLTSLIFIVLANHYFLNEKLNLQQGMGAFIILIGVIVMFK
jgi:drug/metabolite transporter (DMT)-like permease